MKRRLAAAVAVRNQGSRLYGKPIQNLDIEHGIRILDNIIDCLQSVECIDEVVLGVSEGVENEVYRRIADEKGLRHIVGDEVDVLGRLIQCGHAAGATDVFRVTSESPFLYFEEVEQAWNRYQKEQADAVFMDHIVDGVGFEILSLAALEKCHERGESRHRSELCTLYMRENRKDFSIIRLVGPEELNRMDLRLTVDYPEDLVLCRKIYAALKDKAPRIPISEIVKFLDANPELIELTAPYTEVGYSSMFVWAEDG